jgi:hypothetical protein
MSMQVVCPCGNTYQLQDEDCEARCLACGRVLQVGNPGEAPSPRRANKKSERGRQVAALAGGTLEERIARRAKEAEKGGTLVSVLLGALCFVVAGISFFVFPYLPGPARVGGPSPDGVAATMPLWGKWLCLSAFSVPGLVLWLRAFLNWMKIYIHIPFFSEWTMNSQRWGGPDG